MQLEEKQSRRVGWKDPDVGKVCASRDQKEDSVAGACGVSEGKVGRWGGGRGRGWVLRESGSPRLSHPLHIQARPAHKSSYLCFCWCVAPSAVSSERVRRGQGLSREKGSLEMLITSVGSQALWRFKRTLHPRDVSGTRPQPLGP